MFRYNQTSHVLAKFELRLPDIKVDPFQLSYQTNFQGEYKLPISEFIDYKKMGMRQIAPHNSVVKTSQSCLCIQVKDMTRPDSMLATNPNKDIVEDRKTHQSVGWKEVKNDLDRIKKILFYWEWILELDTFIHRF